jgi:hypothetical protein
MTRWMLLATAGLTGCAADRAAPVPPQGACVAGTGAGLVGRKVDAAVEAEARALTGATVVRTVAPGQVTTREFLQERVTLATDAEGRITRVSCG